MKYCPYCGSYNSKNGNFCEHCGAPLSNSVNYNNNYNNNYQYNNNHIQEGNTFGWGVLGFFIPIAGLILFLAWHNDKPKSAKSAGIGALVRVIISIIITILFVLFMIFVEPSKDIKNKWNRTTNEIRENYYEGDWA